jgi:hypothetical protein
MLTLEMFRAARKTVRPDQGPYCPARVVATIGSTEYHFSFASDGNWRLGGIDTYGNYTMAVKMTDVVDAIRKDASGIVVGGQLARYLAHEVVAPS